jgi:hypothetical protein
VRFIATASTAAWDLLGLRKEQPYEDDVVPGLREVKAEGRRKWKDIANRITVYKS